VSDSSSSDESSWEQPTIKLESLSQISLPLTSSALESNALHDKQNHTICLYAKPSSSITIPFRPIDWKFEAKYCTSKLQPTGFKPGKIRLKRAKYDIGKPRRRSQFTNPPNFQSCGSGVKYEN